MSKRTKKPMTVKDIPKTWGGLVRLYPLRPVHDEVDRENVTEIIDAMAGHELMPDQDDYLDSISTLLHAYESEHHRVDTSGVSGLDVLHSLMEDHGMSAAELGRLLDVHRSHAAKIVRGERALTVDHLRRLSERFKVRPDVFIDL